MNWSPEDCSSNYTLLDSKIYPLRHGPNLLLLERNNQITYKKIYKLGMKHNFQVKDSC